MYMMCGYRVFFNYLYYLATFVYSNYRDAVAMQTIELPIIQQCAIILLPQCDTQKAAIQIYFQAPTYVLSVASDLQRKHMRGASAFYL